MGSERVSESKQEATSERARAPVVPALANQGQNPLLLLQRQVGNRAVGRLVARRPAPPRPVQRQEGGEAAPATAAGATAKAAALQQLSTQWGITNVAEGTLAEQASHIARVNRGLTSEEAARLLQQAGWQPWSPPENDAMWTRLATSFDEFGRSMGGMPPVTSLRFFKQDYRYEPAGDSGPTLVPAGAVGATYSAGILEVFEASRRQRAIASRRGEAGSPAPATGAGIGYTISHELGHGVVEQMFAADPGMFDRYKRAAGWVGGALYDIGRPEVAQAIESGRAPDARFRITARNWNDPSLAEQPMSSYMTSAAHEDFPEAVAAYVQRPSVLEARSPRRFAFLRDNADAIRDALRAQPTGAQPAATH